MSESADSWANVGAVRRHNRKTVRKRMSQVYYTKAKRADGINVVLEFHPKVEIALESIRALL